MGFSYDERDDGVFWVPGRSRERTWWCELRSPPSASVNSSSCVPDPVIIRNISWRLSPKLSGFNRL